MPWHASLNDSKFKRIDEIIIFLFFEIKLLQNRAHNLKIQIKRQLFVIKLSFEYKMIAKIMQAIIFMKKMYLEMASNL